MKKVLLLIFCFFLLISSKLLAVHLSAAKIHYNYIGDSTGISHHYEIFLTLYGDGGFSSGVDIYVNSSCYGSSSLRLSPYSLPHDSILASGGVYNPAHCISENLNQNLVVPEYKFKGTIVLPDTCHDFSFSWSKCCRGSNISNLPSPQQTMVWAGATLDNTVSQNSSPKILSPTIATYCVGQRVNWSQYAIEEDGDSLFYELVPHNGPMAAGYTHSQPISTTSGVSLDSSNGNFIFTPSQQESDVLIFEVKEFKYDSLAQSWYLAGSSTRSALLHIVQNCSPTAQDFDLTPEGFTGSGIAELKCGEKMIYLTTSTLIESNSVASDGSDFALFNSQGNIIPIKAAGTVTSVGAFSNHLWLQIHDSIYYNDSLHLVSRLGNDQNTLINSCGFMMAEHDSIPLFVNTCGTSVGMEEKSIESFSIYPNPAQDILHIDFLKPSGKRKVQIFDLHGKLIKQVDCSAIQNEISIADFPAGLYLIKAFGEEVTESYRFQKL